MDAARFINTLDRVAPPSITPTTADFAILDLAANNDLLRQIYAAMTTEPVQWHSLFENTSWFAEWQHGPALVDLREAPRFREALVEQMVQAPIGLLINSAWSMSGLHVHLTRWVHEGLIAQGNLFRLHEPRMFGPLLCVLDNAQSQAMLKAGSAWSWHDTHVWRSAKWEAHASAIPDDAIPGVAPPQLEATEPYWLAAEAKGYTQHYGQSLPTDRSPEHWVLERLLEGSRMGFQRSSHLERWLRLAIRHGERFHIQMPFAVHLKETQITLNDRLNAMEGEVEKQHASV